MQLWLNDGIHRRDEITLIRKIFEVLQRNIMIPSPTGEDCAVERNSLLISLISTLSEELHSPMKTEEKQGYKSKGIVKVYPLSLGFISLSSIVRVN